jgi:hypothetical protein
MAAACEPTPEHEPGHPALRSLHILTYDTTVYPFAEHVSKLVGGGIEPDKLHCIHLVDELMTNGKPARGTHRWTQAVNWTRGDGGGDTTLPDLLERCDLLLHPARRREWKAATLETDPSVQRWTKLRIVTIRVWQGATENGP